MFTPHSHEASISVKQFSFYAAVGPINSRAFYYGQAFYRPVGGTYAWQLEYLVTRYIPSHLKVSGIVSDMLTCCILFSQIHVQWVQNEYEKDRWTQNHKQHLQFDEPKDNSPPSITLCICSPADEEEKQWLIQPLSTPQVRVTTNSSFLLIPTAAFIVVSFPHVQ